MFERLIASAPRRRRSAGQVVTAVAVHAGLGLLAVQATTSRADPGPPRARPDTLVWELAAPVPDPAPDAAAPRRVGGTTPQPDAVVAPAAPQLPSLPFPAEISPGIPAPDGASLARRFRAGDVGTSAVSGPRIDSTRAFTAAQLDRIVELLEQPSPVYPPALRDAGLTGYADVEFVVGRDGSVEPETVRVTAATHPAFAASASTAVLGARFRPALLRGAAVRQQVRQRVRFDTVPAGG